MSATLSLTPDKNGFELKISQKNNNNKELHGRMMQISGRIKGGKKETLNAKHNTFLWVF